MMAMCGNGMVEPGEECDKGMLNSDTGACTTMCKNATCGDGLVEMGVEQCDMGAMNSDTGACTSMCKTATCGDGLVEMGVEQCDMGAMNSNTGACTLACKSAACGDGFVQMGVEECDQGMQNSNTGACTLMCKSAKCGDGFVQMGVEQCDDGNMTQGDGCNIDCKPSGSVVFTKTFNGPINGNEVWRAVTLDAAGNIYVAGFQATSVANGSDAVVRKYDAMGNVVWTQTYNGAASKDDAAYGVAVDAQGNVIVTGAETLADTHTDVWMRKYSSAGATIWTQTYNLGAMGFDNAGNAVAVNAMGDIYLAATGQSVAANNADIIVAKVAGINGSTVWADIVNGASSGADEAFGIAVDPSGAVLATGYTTTATGADAWVRKYTDNGVTKTIVWTRTYNSLANGNDFGTAITADPMGNVLVTGAEAVANQGLNVWVRKYDTMGNTVWTQGYNNISNNNDFGFGIACDQSGDVIVGGQETIANMTTDVWVRKYSPAGATLWTQGYNGAADQADGVNGIAVDANGFIYAAGFETTSNTAVDGWLRKYEP